MSERIQRACRGRAERSLGLLLAKRAVLTQRAHVTRARAQIRLVRRAFQQQLVQIRSPLRLLLLLRVVGNRADFQRVHFGNRLRNEQEGQDGHQNRNHLRQHVHVSQTHHIKHFLYQLSSSFLC